MKDALHRLIVNISRELTSKRARSFLSILALSFISIVFFYDALSTGRLLTERDLGLFFIPPRHFWVESIRAGDLPLWNPLNFGGHPFFAALQPAVLYPFNLLFHLLPFNHAFNWIIIVHFFLAAAFAYALLRFLDAGRIASFFGASVFLLGGYMLSVHNLLSTLLSVVWLPLILLLFGRALRFHSLWSAAWAGIVLAISFFGGGIEAVMGTCLALGLMALFSRTFGAGGIFAVKALAVAGVVFTGMSSIQLIPFLELAGKSVRQSGLSYEEATVWSASVVDFVSFFVQDPYGSMSGGEKYWIRQSWLKTLYMGGLPFVLAAIYLVTGRKREAAEVSPSPYLSHEGRGTMMKYFWLIFVAVSIFIALGGFNPLYPYLYKFAPIVNKIRYPVKFLFLGVFALSVMAGLGFQRLLETARRGEGQRLKWAAIILATLAALALAWLNIQHDGVLAFMKAAGLDAPAYNNAAINLYNLKRMLFYLVAGCAAMWFVIETKGSRYAVWALCIVAILDLFGNLGYYQSTDPRVYWADNWTVKQLKADLSDNRVFITPLAEQSTFFAPDLDPTFSQQRILSGSLNLNYNIRSMWGMEVLRVKRTDDLYKSLIATPSVDATRIIDLFSTKYVVSTKPIVSPYFTLAGADIEGLEGSQKELLDKPTIKVYRNERALPRTYLVKDYRVESDPAASLAFVSRGDFDPAKTVVLEEPPAWGQSIASNIVPKERVGADIVRESNNKVEIHARVAEPSLLYLADTFYPGWNAYVDGRKTKIYRANYNFRAVPLPPGEHEVKFRYEPLSFYAGAVITGVTLLVLIGLGLRSYLIRRRQTGYGHCGLSVR